MRMFRKFATALMYALLPTYSPFWYFLVTKILPPQKTIYTVPGVPKEMDDELSRLGIQGTSMFLTALEA